MKRILFMVLTVLFAGTAVSAFIASPTAASATEPSALLSQPVGTLEACDDCSACDPPGAAEVGHKTFAGDASSIHERNAGPHGDCWDTGTCGMFHPPTCQPSHDDMLASLEAVRQAVLEGDGDALRELVRDRVETVSWVPSRNAVQVRGCKGFIVAHFPLSAELQTTLSH